MIAFMEKAYLCFKMVIFIKGNGRIVCQMGEEHILVAVLIGNTQVYGRKENKMAKVLKHFKMDLTMKGSFKMVSGTVKENLKIKKVRFIKALLFKDKSMVLLKQ